MNNFNWASFLLGILLGVVGFFALSKMMGLGAQGALSASQGDATITGGDGAAAAEATQRWQQKLSEKETKIAELENEVARLNTRMQRTPMVEVQQDEQANLAEEKTTEETATSTGPTFTFPGLEEALAQVDWSTSGKAIAAMAPMIDQLAKQMAEGEPDLELFGQLQRWNGELVSMAVRLQKMDVPGTGVNGAFTHPSVTANLMDAALTKSDMPLGPEQEERLRDLGQRYYNEDTMRLANYGDDVPAFRKLLEEAALKDRFYHDAGMLLSPEQRNLLYPASAEGRLGLDMFSSGILWAPNMKRMRYSNREDLASGISSHLKSTLKLSDAEYAHVQEAVAKWSSNLSSEFLEGPNDSLSKQGLVTSSRLAEVAQRQMELLESLLSKTNLTADQRRTLLDDPTLLLPVRE